MRKLLASVMVCLSFHSQSQTLCAGSSTALQAPNPQNLTSPLTYSLNPGANTSPTGSFLVTPPVTTTYTLYTTGTNTANVIVTTTSVITVTVFSRPVVTPTLIQTSCTSTVNSFNLNLTWVPANSPPTYTVSWGGTPVPNIPQGLLSPQQTTLTGGISPGVYTVIITSADGCSTTQSFTMDSQPAQANFSILPLGTNFSITCSQPTLFLSTSVAAHNYTWASANTGPITGTDIAITNTAAGGWSVVAQHTLSNCTSIKFFTVGINQTAPSSTISPISQNVTCSNSAVQTVSLYANLATNITHYIFSQQQTTFAFNTQTAVNVPPIGTHTYVLLDLANGCSTAKTFTVSSGVGIPIFTIQSVAPGFTLGCSSKSLINVGIAPGSVTTSPSQGGVVTYTCLAPNASTVLTLASPLSTVSTYSINTPGTWTFVVRSDGNWCDSRLPFTVLQNTIGPGVDTILVPQNVLTCFTKSVVIQGVSESTNVVYFWNYPSVSGPISVASATLPIVINSVTPTNTVINNYTLTIEDNNNLCRSTATLVMLQNLFAPKTKITASSPTITCASPTVLLTNSGSSGVPPGLTIFPQPLPIGYLWQGPSPQFPASLQTTYLAEISGGYTLTSQDPNNGCLSSTVFVVAENKEYPDFYTTDAQKGLFEGKVLDCGSVASLSVDIQPAISKPLYFWAGMTAASISPTRTARGITTNLKGDYSVTVTNADNGCSVTKTLSVGTGSLTADIAADRTTGYAPLTVNLANNSRSKNDNSNIATAWSFGNGTSSVTASFSITPTTVYNLPGTYTITAFTTKGNCVDTAWQFIKVEIPSELSVPNVFTPNGDNVNDLFFVKASNLREIHMTIIDRWGHVTYELTTEKGQIEWDGKNQFGKESPEGTYFYVITAKGKDDMDYNKKGTINLIR